MKVTVAINLAVHVQLDTTQDYAAGPTYADLARWQKEAVEQIDTLTRAQIDDAIQRAKNIGATYPADVAEVVNTEE